VSEHRALWPSCRAGRIDNSLYFVKGKALPGDGLPGARIIGVAAVGTAHSVADGFAAAFACSAAANAAGGTAAGTAGAAQGAGGGFSRIGIEENQFGSKCVGPTASLGNCGLGALCQSGSG